MTNAIPSDHKFAILHLGAPHATIEVGDVISTHPNLISAMEARARMGALSNCSVVALDMPSSADDHEDDMLADISVSDYAAVRGGGRTPREIFTA